MTQLKIAASPCTCTSPVTSQEALRAVKAGKRICRKYRKQLWRRECKNLKAILPTVANKKVSEVEVIEEAVGYIEQLHKAIADRLGVLPNDQMVAALHHMARMRSAAHAQARLPHPATPRDEMMLSASATACQQSLQQQQQHFQLQQQRLAMLQHQQQRSSCMTSRQLPASPYYATKTFTPMRL